MFKVVTNKKWVATMCCLFLALAIAVLQVDGGEARHNYNPQEQNGPYPHYTKTVKAQRRHRQHRNQPEQQSTDNISSVPQLTTLSPPPPTTTPVAAAPSAEQPFWTDKLIVEELLKKYRFPDPSTNISVAVLLDIERVLNADVVDDLCRLQLVITQKWLEPRLEYKQLRDSAHPVRLRSMSYVWNPSLNVENALSVLPLGKDSLKIFSGGVVEHVQRIQVITIAETNLHNFPFDTRNCTLVLSNDDSRAIWSRVLSITLPQDHIHSAATSDLVVNDARMREYRHVEVSLKRCLHSWTIWLFGPTLVLLLTTCLCTTCSCLVHFPPLVRVVLSVTCFASIMFITSTSNAQIARTNEWTALDQWIIAVRAASLLAVICACLNDKNSFSSSIEEIESQCYEQNDGKARWMAATGTRRHSSSNGQPLPYYTQLMNSGQKKSYTRVLLAQLASLTMRAVGPIAFILFLIYYISVFVKPYNDHQ